jgi:LuxR family maltose regulon positive regulatory protein
MIHLISGELNPLREQSRRMQHTTSKYQSPTLRAWSFYLEGIGSLHACDLDAAARLFEEAVSYRYHLDTRAWLDAACGLAIAQQLHQQTESAQETVDRLFEFARETNAPEIMSDVFSCQARLALLRGELEPAVRWARSIDDTPVSMAMFMWLEVTWITRARILIAEGSQGNLEAANTLLESICRETKKARLDNQTIEVAVLQALGLEKQGRADRALAAVNDALALAEPGGWIRPFVEAGPAMAALLRRFAKQGDGGDFVRRVLSAFAYNGATGPADRPPAGTGSTLDDLTPREFEIVQLLAQRLQNKEIAARLYISTHTVNDHLKHIYQKLGVSSRRQAVDHAVEMGILGLPSSD